MKRIYLLLSLLTGCLYMQAAIYNLSGKAAMCALSEQKQLERHTITRTSQLRWHNRARSLWTL